MEVTEFSYKPHRIPFRSILDAIPVIPYSDGMQIPRACVYWCRITAIVYGGNSHRHHAHQPLVPIRPLFPSDTRNAFFYFTFF
jgi:hypothetical protein